MENVAKMSKSQNRYSTPKTHTYALNASAALEKLEDKPAEGRFLASVCQYGLDAYIDVEGIVVENSFTEEANQIIWRCLVNFFDLEECKPTLASIMKYADALGYKNFFEKKDEKDYLRGLFQLPVELQDARILGGQLRKLQIKREFFNVLEIGANNLIAANPLEPLSKIISSVEVPMNDYLMKLASGDEEGKLLTDGGDIYLANLFDNPNTVIGFQTGFPKYDDYIGCGLEPETLHIIVARAKVGKSSFLLNTSINLSKQNVSSIILDYEMSQKKWMNRFLSNLTQINIRKFKTASFSEEEKDKINDAYKIIKDYPIYYLNINGKSVDEALFCAKRMLNKKIGKGEDGKYKCTLIYDYLRLNDGEDISKNIQEYQALMFQGLKIKDFLIQNKLPGMTCVQANRGGIDTEDTSVASGSDRVLWICDSMCLFKRKSEEEIAEDKSHNRNFNRKMVFLETRDGAEVDAGTYINYNFDGGIAKITEGPLNTELRTNKKIQVDDADKATNI